MPDLAQAASDNGKLGIWTHLWLGGLDSEVNGGNHIKDNVADCDDDPRNIGHPAADVYSASNWERQYALTDSKII